MLRPAHRYPNVAPSPTVPIVPDANPIVPLTPSVADPPFDSSLVFMTDEVVDIEESPDMDATQDV
jgi:hypothetical protein